MQKPKLLVATALAVLGAAALALRFFSGDVDPGRGVSLERALEGLDALARQFPPPGEQPLDWPRDHAAKPEQFAESWLFAGRVRDQAGRSYGFQLGFDRIALQQDEKGRESEWAARDLYRARLSVEPAAATMFSEQRVSRAALGLAGAETGFPKVWVEDWSFSMDEAGAAFLLRGSAAGTGLSLRLTLPADMPTAVDAELYRGYWWPGLGVEGTLEIAGRSEAVTGTGMLDRLWGRALPIGRGQLSLARLWLELDDGSALRCQQLRRRAGGGTPLTECIGDPVPPPAALELQPDERGWQTVGTTRYPLSWSVRLPGNEQALVLEPLAGERDPSLGGGWSGVVVADDDRHWGLLELSNFGAP